jgi:hypothetical protein
MYRTLSLTNMLAAILVKYHGYFACREKSKHKKTSILQKNWSGEGRWHKLGAVFCKNWLLGANSTKQQGHCLGRLRMVRLLQSLLLECETRVAFIDAESSSARRARSQQYYAPDGNRTTFHHYVPTNGGKVKPTQAVPMTGLVLLASSY